MTRLGPKVLVIVVPLLACGGTPARRTSTTNEPDPMEEPVKKDSAAPAGKMDAKPATPSKDAEPAISPDTAREPEPDAGSSTPPDAGTTAPDATTSTGDSGGGAPAVEAKWSHTMCTQSQLKYPNIDKNMGKFPPGSCPPPEDLPRPCGGNSKLTVMKATTSGYETGYWHPAEYAHDQYMMTRWSSPGNMATAWLALDLGTEQTFKRIYLAWELSHASEYDIATSNDGTTWAMLKHVTGGNGYQDIIDVDAKARHLRITGLVKGKTDTGGATYGYSLFDVTVCGERP